MVEDTVPREVILKISDIDPRTARPGRRLRRLNDDSSYRRILLGIVCGEIPKWHSSFSRWILPFQKLIIREGGQSLVCSFQRTRSSPVYHEIGCIPSGDTILKQDVPLILEGGNASVLKKKSFVNLVSVHFSKI